jgi:FG-GAP repeat
VKRSAFAAAMTLAATLVFGVSGPLAASLPGSPLTKMAARDGVSVPPSLTHAIAQSLRAAPAVAIGQAQSQQQELQAPDGVPGDFFGETVSLSGDGRTALVGAPFRAIGAAHVFVEQGGKWTLHQQVQSPAGAGTDSYGFSVALSGDGSTHVLGPPDPNPAAGAGRPGARQRGRIRILGRARRPRRPAADRRSVPGEWPGSGLGARKLTRVRRWRPHGTAATGCQGTAAGSRSAAVLRCADARPVPSRPRARLAKMAT